MAKIYDAVLKLNSSPFAKGLERAEAHLERFGKQYKDTAKQLRSSSKFFGSIGSTLTKAVTMPIVGGLAATIKTGAGFEQQMAKVSAISGATGSDFDKLSALARKMGSETKFSATEAAEGLQYMAMAGWNTQQMAAGLGPILNLAIASGEDLGTTSDIVTDALTAFKLKAEDAGHFADVLAAASNAANTNVGMLGESFKYAAPLAGAMGYSIEDVSLALGLMANAGIKSSMAGTSLSGALMRLGSPTKQVQTAMDNLGLTMADAQGNMRPLRDVMDDLRKSFGGLTQEQQVYNAEQLFGKEAAKGMLAIINASAEDYEKLAVALDNAEGMTAKMRRTMEDTLGGVWDKLKSSAQESMLQIFDLIKDSVKGAIETVTGLFDAFNKLPDGIQSGILGILGFAAALGPFFLIVSKVLGLMANGLFVFSNLATAVGKAGGLMALISGPAGTVVAVLAAIAVAAYLVIRNWDKIKEKAQEVFPGIGEFLSGIWESLKASFSSIGESLGSILAVFAPTLELLKGLFGSLLEFIIGVVVPGILGFITIMAEGVANVIGGMAPVFQAFGAVVSAVVYIVISMLKGIIDFINGVFKTNWAAAWDAAKQKFSDVWNSIRSTATNALNSILSKIQSVISMIKNIRLPKLDFGSLERRIASVGHNASGTASWSGGPTYVHEKGGEIIDLPSGTRIYPHDKSIGEAYRAGARTTNNKTSTTITIPKLADQIIVREDADIDRIVSRMVAKLQITKFNTVGV